MNQELKNQEFKYQILKNQALKNTLVAQYIVIVHVVVTMAIAYATQQNGLIPAAFPFALTLILMLFFMPEKAELIAWSTLTLWLGSTYSSTGATAEIILFLGYGILAVLGLFKSPMFLAIAWLFHPLWDMLPRELPDHLLDLPMACLLFDTPIGIYLLWGTLKRRWSVFAEPLNQQKWYQFAETEQVRNIAKSLFILMTIVGLSLILNSVSKKHQLLLWSLPCAIWTMVSLHLLKGKAELIAWACLPATLAMPESHAQGFVGVGLLLMIVAIATLSVLRTATYLVYTWILLALYHLVIWLGSTGEAVRSMAFVIFCVPICIYIVCSVKAARWGELEYVN